MANDDEVYYWLRGRHDDVRLECIEITHPSFTKIYRFVRNHADGVRVKHGSWYDYEYLPITIKTSKSADNLNQGMSLGIGDVGDIIPMEIDRLRNGSHKTSRPIINYRVYLTSDLSTPVDSILGLEVTDNNPQNAGAVLTCRARDLNKSSTGLIYNLYDDPTLIGFT